MMRAPLATLAAACFCIAAGTAARAERVLSIGGSVTEIVYALGESDRLIGRDSTSSYPPEVLDLPDVGYVRALSPEGVLSLNPDLILAEEGAGPPEVVEVLSQAGVPFVTIPEAYSRDGIAAKIVAVGDALGTPDKASALAATIDAELRAAEDRATGIAEGDRKRVLFVLSTTGGRILASGRGTAADGIIAMAGGQNAVTEFEGYKPLTDEAVTQAQPDVILMMDRTGDHTSGDDELFALPAIATTPAAANRKLVRMDGLYLLGFGPRTAAAVTELHAAIYGN